MKKKLILIVASMITIMSTAGCSGSSASTMITSSSDYKDESVASDTYENSGNTSGFQDYTDNDIANDAESSESDNDSNNEGSDSDSDDNSNIDNAKNNTNNDVKLYESKLVYRCEMTIETLDYDKSYSELQKLMEKYSCIIESERFGDDSLSYLYDGYRTEYNGYKNGRQDEIIIRVPSEKYKEFLNEYNSLGNITSKTQSVDNITQEYYDTTSQVKGLKEEMKRLEEMLNQATDIKDMVTINSQITDLQSEINSLTTQIRTMDNDVAYSYVTLTLKEVLEYTEEDTPVKTNKFIDRLKNQCVDTWKGFLKFLENLLFFVISIIPAVIIIGIIIIIIKITCKEKIKTWKENRKLRKVSDNGSISELSTLLKYDENKVNSGVDTDEQKSNQ